jgi:CDGSH-type Zn-finger protein
MADEPTITVTPNGPYLVSGAPLVVKTPVHTDQGEPIAWVTGPPLETRERYALCRCGESSKKPFCDGTHASVGFDGTESASGTYADRSKEYAGQGVVVRDDRSICVHAGFCGTAATNVWKMVGPSDATQVRSLMLAMIERCPSGALSYSFEGAASANEPDLGVHVSVIPDGPLFVSGGVHVTKADGTEDIERRNRVTLCRCGHSSNKPLCDGTHKEIGFRHTP